MASAGGPSAGPPLPGEPRALRFVTPERLLSLSPDGELSGAGARRFHGLDAGEGLAFPVDAGDTSRIVVKDGDAADLAVSCVEEGGAVVPVLPAILGDAIYVRAPDGCIAMLVTARREGVRARVQLAAGIERPLHWEMAERGAMRAIDAGEGVDPGLSESERKVAALRRKARYLWDIEELERQDPGLFDIHGAPDPEGASAITTVSPAGRETRYVHASRWELSVEGPVHLRVKARLSQAPADGAPLQTTVAWLSIDRRDRRPVEAALVSAPADFWIRVGLGRHRVVMELDKDSWVSAEIWRRRRRRSLEDRSTRDLRALLAELPDFEPGAMGSMPAESTERSPWHTLDPIAAPERRAEIAIDSGAIRGLPEGRAEELPAAARAERGAAVAMSPGKLYDLPPTHAATLTALHSGAGSATILLRIDGGPDLPWPLAHREQEIRISGRQVAMRGIVPESARPVLLLTPGLGQGDPVFARAYIRLASGESLAYVLPDDGHAHDLRLMTRDAEMLSVAIDSSVRQVSFAGIADAIARMLGISAAGEPRTARLTAPPGRRRIGIENRGSAEALVRLQRRALP